ncbi:MAG: radical SAM protein [Promethearchaeati archaeon SRVP18_Atabeyarchaeia-1]
MSYKVLVANLPGLVEERTGHFRHYVKAGSRWPFTAGFGREIGYLPYPFFLGYTSALLKRDSEAEVKGIDGVVEHMTDKEFLAKLKQESPDLVIAEVPILTMTDDLELLKKIKEELGAKIVVCGPQTTSMAREILTNSQHIDYVMLGEYELTALELVDRLVRKSSNDARTIKGLAWRDNGKIILNERRPLLKDLDFLPFPDREDFPGDKYRDFAFLMPCIQMYSSRGCPFRCIFCAERQVFYAEPTYRMRNPGKVVDEMELVIERFKARQIYFDDMTFTVRGEHATGICREIIRRKLEIPWTCMGDAMASTFGELEIMKKAGCIGMKFGVESAVPEILKNIGKPLDLAKVRQVVEWLRRLGIRSHATYCIGLPGETLETINQTLKFASSLGSDSCQISMATPYPGTPFFELCKKEGYLTTTDFSKYDGTQNAVIAYPNLSADAIKKSYELAKESLFKPGKSFSLAWYMSRPRIALKTIMLNYHKNGLKGLLALFRKGLGKLA